MLSDAGEAGGVGSLKTAPIFRCRLGRLVKELPAMLVAGDGCLLRCRLGRLLEGGVAGNAGCCGVCGCFAAFQKRHPCCRSWEEQVLLVMLFARCWRWGCAASQNGACVCLGAFLGRLLQSGVAGVAGVLGVMLSSPKAFLDGDDGWLPKYFHCQASTFDFEALEFRMLEGTPESVNPSTPQKQTSKLGRSLPPTDSRVHGFRDLWV